MAGLLLLGSHEMGHINEADSLAVPLSFNEQGVWWASTEDPTQLTRIANSGFINQDRFSGLFHESPLEKSIYLVSGLNKIGYVLKYKGIQNTEGLLSDTGSYKRTQSLEGDIFMIEKHKGETARKLTQAALTLSAISDLLIAFDKIDSEVRLCFGQSDNGDPMLILSTRF